MKIRVVAYGVSKDILGARAMEVDLTGNPTLGGLRQQLLQHYPGLSKLKRLSFAAGEEYRTDDYPLSDGDEVAIIPPVAGG